MTTSTFNWTARDVSCAAAVLGKAGTEGFQLPTLTDEEVVALDGVQRDQIVALPWLSTQQADRDILCAVALRGLLAKELVYPVIFEGETEPSRLHANDDITGALTLRRSGANVLSIERTVSTGRRWLYAYTHADGVLLEEVDDGGLHGFTVVTREELPTRLEAFVDPDGTASGDTEPVSYTEEAFEAQAPLVLADTQAASNVVAFNTETEDFPTVTVYTGPESVQVLTPRVHGDSVSLELRGASHATLAGILAGLAGLS